MKEEEKKYKNKVEECNHSNAERKVTMSFIFNDCPDCGYHWTETNRSPAIFNSYNRQQVY